MVPFFFPTPWKMQKLKRNHLALLSRKSVTIFPILLFAFFISVSFSGGDVQSAEKIIIGPVEEVVLLPWGIRLPARMDTGAATSSLDARELVVKGDQAHFKLPSQYGGASLTVPVVAWRTIRSAEARERRPVVEMEFCLGARVVRARVNLNDRSNVKYPFLVGRNALRKHYVIDCMKNYCAPPSCPQVAPK